MDPRSATCLPEGSALPYALRSADRGVRLPISRCLAPFCTMLCSRRKTEIEGASMCVDSALNCRLADRNLGIRSGLDNLTRYRPPPASIDNTPKQARPRDIISSWTPLRGGARNRPLLLHPRPHGRDLRCLLLYVLTTTGGVGVVFLFGTGCDTPLCNISPRASTMGNITFLGFKRTKPMTPDKYLGSWEEATWGRSINCQTLGRDGITHVLLCIGRPSGYGL